MMNTLIRLTIISALIFLSGSSFGQNRADSLSLAGRHVQLDNLRKIRPEFYRKSVGLDSAKAAGVAKVQDAFKVALYAVERDSSLSQEVKRKQMRSLMLDRNQKLRGILDPREQQQVIPSTELHPEKIQPSAE